MHTPVVAHSSSSSRSSTMSFPAPTKEREGQQQLHQRREAAEGKSDKQQQQQESDEGWLDPFSAMNLTAAYFKAFQTPLDRMKVLLQSSLEIKASLTPYQKSLLGSPLDTTRSIASHVWRTEGFSGLWRGSILGFAGSLLHSYAGIGVSVFVNWAAQPKIGTSEHDGVNARQRLVARKGYYSVLVGVLLSMVLYPLDMIRLVRMMDMRFPVAGRVDFEYPHLRHIYSSVQQGKFVFRNVPKSFLEDAAPATINVLKYSTLWRGYGLSLGGMLTYRASHFFMGSVGLGVFDSLSNNKNNYTSNELVGMTPMQEFAFGFSISMLANAAVYPLDVFRSRFIRAGFVSSPLPGGGDHISMRDLAAMIWRNEGVKGYYRGGAFALTVRASTLSIAGFAVPFFANSVSGGGGK